MANANITKAGSNADLTATGAWVGGVVPGNTDVAVWATGSLAGTTLTGALNVSGISFTAATLGPVGSGSAIWTIGSAGIDFRGYGNVTSTTSRISLTAGASYATAADHTLWLNSTETLSAQMGVYQLSGTHRITLKNAYARTNIQTLFIQGTGSSFVGIIDLSDSNVLFNPVSNATSSSATVIGSVSGWYYNCATASGVLPAALQVGANGTLGVASAVRTWSVSGPVSFTSSATVFTDGSPTGLITLSGGVSVPSGITATLSPIAATPITISTNGFSGSGSIIKAGAGGLTVSAASSATTPFTGTFQANTAVTISTANAIGDATFVVTGAGTVTWPASFAIGALSGTASYAGFGTNTLTLGGVNSDISSTWNGNFTSNVALIKSAPSGGTSVLQLGGVSTRTTAGTTISRGAIQLNAATGLYATGSTNTTTVNSGGGLWLNGVTTITASAATIAGDGVALNGAIRNVGGNSTHTATITCNGSARIFNDVASTTLTIKNLALGAASTLTIDTGSTSTATILLDGTSNTASGTSATVITGSGLVKAPRQATLSNTRPVTVNAGARLQFTDTTATIGIIGNTLSSTAGGTAARIILGA